jgi:glycosyltransferase involved in cell wall biosynthesis
MVQDGTLTMQHEERRAERHTGWQVPGAGAAGPTARSCAEDTNAMAATIILPAYNEAAALPEVLASLLAVLDGHCEVIVVDDASSDETPAIASAYPCRLLRHAHNKGKGAAVSTGVAAARGRFIIVMDADNTYPAEAVPRMIALAKEYEFVRCTRLHDAATMPRINHLGNKLFDHLLQTVYGLQGGDHLTGLYGLRRDALQAMDITASGFDLEVEIGIKARAQQLRSTSLPIRYGVRLGEKKLRTWRDGWSILRRILSLARLYNPGLAFILPGLLLWSLAALLTVILSYDAAARPYLGLSVHSFVVAALGATTGFQVVVFGIAAALHAVERGVPPGSWLRAVSSRPVRRGAALLGTLCSAAGATQLAAIALQWLANGGGAFTHLRALVVAGALLSWGIQVLLALVFLTIIESRRERRASLPAWQEMESPASAPLGDVGQGQAVGISMSRRHTMASPPGVRPMAERGVLMGQHCSATSSSDVPEPLGVACAQQAVSVVICTFAEDRWDELIGAVASVHAQSQPPREIIVVVDHNPGLLARVRAQVPGVVAVENSAARGLSEARNSGIAAARGTVIAFLDDDAVAPPDWLAHLSAGYRDLHVLGVGGPVEPLWLSGRPEWFPEEFDWVVGCTFRGLPQTSRPVHRLIGCNMSFQRAVFDAVGGFRRGIGRVGTRPFAGEETELCIRVAKHWPQGVLLYKPQAWVQHRVPQRRACWRYYCSRCYCEGLSKALITRLIGVGDSLAAERTYTARALPRGIVRGLADTVCRGDVTGLARAGAITAGLLITTAGYAWGARSQRVTPGQTPFPSTIAPDCGRPTFIPVSVRQDRAVRMNEIAQREGVR